MVDQADDSVEAKERSLAGWEQSLAGLDAAELLRKLLPSETNESISLKSKLHKLINAKDGTCVWVSSNNPS